MYVYKWNYDLRPRVTDKGRKVERLSAHNRFEHGSQEGNRFVRYADRERQEQRRRDRQAEEREEVRRNLYGSTFYAEA